MALFTADTLRKSFTNGEVEEQVLKGISLSLNKGEITALAGASGSGKSTLLTIAAGLQQASNGTIIFDGQDMTAMSQENIRKIRAFESWFVFQSFHLVPVLTVEEERMVIRDGGGSKMKKAERKEKVQKVLGPVEMSQRKDGYPPSLSGGEKQRVAISRGV